MSDTYKAGEISIAVTLATSALKGEFAALKQDYGKHGKEASKWFLRASGEEFKGNKDKFKSSFVEIFEASKEAKKAGTLNTKSFAEGLDITNAVNDNFDSAGKVTKKEGKKSAKLFSGVAKASGGAFKAAMASTGIGLIFEVLTVAASKLFGWINKLANSAAIAGEKAGETLENVGSDLEELGTSYNSLTSETRTLELQTVELNKAIEESGKTAETAAKKELEAINKRIAKNKELQRVYEDDARLKLREAQEAQETADTYALAKILEREKPHRTVNHFVRKLNDDSEFKQNAEARLAAELEALSQKDRNGDALSKKDENRFKTLNALYLERAEYAEKVLEAERRVAAFKPPETIEPKTSENGTAGEDANNSDANDNSNPDSIDKRDCEEKCDEKVQQVQDRYNATRERELKSTPLAEPVDTQDDDEAARKAEEAAEQHRQRIQYAEELKRQALGPLADYRDAIAELKKVENNTEAKDVAGGDENIRSAKLNAFRDLASATEDYTKILDELDALLDDNGITVEQYGQAFDDVIQSISDTDKALELLGTRAKNENLNKSPIKKAAIDEANRSLKTSEVYLEAINAEKREALELEAQQIENRLLLAEIGEGEPIDVAAFRERLAIIRESLDLMQRGFTSEQAEGIAPKLIQSSEYNELEGDVKDLFKGGIKAAIDGDFEDFLAGKLQGAADSMFDNALDTLLDGLLGAGGPLEGLIGSLFGGGDGEGDILGGALGGIFGGLFGGGKSDATGGATDALGSFTEGLTAAEGGLGGFGGALASIFGGEGGGGIVGILGGLFAGFFADGGVVPRGQFAIVGEQGPEIISAGASPLRVTPINDNYAATATAGKIPDGGGVRAMSYAPVNNFYGHTQDDLQRSLDDRDRALKAEMPSMMDRHTFNQRRGMA